MTLYDLKIDGRIKTVQTFHGLEFYLTIRIPHFPYDWSKDILLTLDEVESLGKYLDS